jgi:asparagine synthase (glutamine-hydrolysing)
MCRIAGVVTKRLSKDTTLKKVGIMCKTLAHGGPDDEGIFYDETEGLAFGHRRLAIIDLSANGHQPMADVQKKVWITFNGEIYNYRELKSDLHAAGATFHTDSDTEVIINAYLHWGTAAFFKLRGIFAFALYDIEKHITLLVRDTTGIKPLYYHADKGSLSFASEVKAFKAAGISAENDDTWPIKFLAFGHIPEPYTTLKNVLSLAKGHFLVWNNRNGEHNIESYCKPNSIELIKDFNTAAREINESLKLAVKRQLISDAPIGVFLSGGVDSSLLSLLANEQKGEMLQTISIYFNEKSYDERAYQDVISKELKGKKHSHLVTQHDFEEFFPRIITDMDLPTTDGINTWFISKYAHESGLKAVLSGVGADELFGGYPSFYRIKYLKLLRKAPGFFAGAASLFQADRYRKVSFIRHDYPLADYLLLRGLFVPSDIAKALNVDEKQVNETLFKECFVPKIDTYDEQHAAWFETNLYMQNQLLRDTDVMSMSHGLEVRVPFLDEDFQETANRISSEIRFSKKQPKKILIESFMNELPEVTWKRPKMGFTFPLQEWMSRHQEISNEKLYKGEFAKNAVLKFKNGQMHWSKAFALYQIQLHG